MQSNETFLIGQLKKCFGVFTNSAIGINIYNSNFEQIMRSAFLSQKHQTMNEDNRMNFQNLKLIFSKAKGNVGMFDFF
jgi:competence transcription factor ComK